MNAPTSTLPGPDHQQGQDFARLLEGARAQARRAGSRLLDAWAETLGGDVREAARALARGLHYPFLETGDLIAATPDFSHISLSRALQRACMGLRWQEQLYVVLADPFDQDLLNWLEHHLPASVALALCTDGDLKALLGRAELAAKAMDSAPAQAGGEVQGEQRGEEISLVGIAEDASPVVRLVNSTLYDGLKSGASDIHFESTPGGIEVKYRIDGVLNLATSVASPEAAEQAISRIKVLAELDIAERRVPQDGRFRVSVGGRTTDLRVSVMPSIHGEDAVLRILDKRQLVPSGAKLTLDLLGFDAPSLKLVRRLAAEPYGMLLVTGPTGSGKTTTLYAAISETLTGHDKVVTIEDPVEYELPGVLQIPVNERKGLSFARGLRSILRHDPDRIMVGEIRDAETAEIAVQSALTGHLVLSTVHANSVFDVFSRFTHMGIDPHALTAALNGIWAQRLVRTVCNNCAEPHPASPEEIELLSLDAEFLSGATLRTGRGCGDCRGTGYRGRKAIAEILVLNDRLRELIVNKASVLNIKAEAKRGGTRLLRDAALDLARRGHTTLEEVLRVTLQG
ncbi:GspE/PulE family protein [Paucibacter sp. O1-1]|nr:GspE/PulE family protein [Paucibacter sp. O1-1]MDA3831103.1 GspE/PulE family protein [Paucibacter sp. O1-1]